MSRADELRKTYGEHGLADLLVTMERQEERTANKHGKQLAELRAQLAEAAAREVAIRDALIDLQNDLSLAHQTFKDGLTQTSRAHAALLQTILSDRFGALSAPPSSAAAELEALRVAVGALKYLADGLRLVLRRQVVRDLGERESAAENALKAVDAARGGKTEQ